MANSLEDQIREIRTAISTAQARKARAAVELDTAKERLAAARETLSKDFGVATTEDAKAKLAELRSALDATVEEIEKALADAGA